MTGDHDGGRQQDVGDSAEGEDDGDESVRREKGGVDPGEVSGLDDDVLVQESGRGREDSGGKESASSREAPDGEKQRNHRRVERGRDGERRPRPPARRQGFQPGAAIVVLVLEGVEDIEAGRPEENREPEEDGSPREASADGDPRPDGRERQTQAEDEVRKPGEALRVGIEEKKRERRGREGEGQAIQARRGEEEENDRAREEDPDEAGRDRAGRKGARSRARVRGVDRVIGQPVVRHRRAASTDHGQQDLGERRP